MPTIRVDPSAITPGSGIMVRLRTATAEQHAKAESHPFQRGLASGALPIASYIRELEQRLIVHRAIEPALRQLLEQRPELRRVVTADQFQEAYLLEDLAALGGSTSPELTSGTRWLLERIAERVAANPESVLGYHYVLEGSNNGSRFIARAIRRAYGLGVGAGTRYLDPYGEAQPGKWAGFKAGMDEAEFAEPSRESMIEAAREMFDGIARTSDDLLATRSQLS